MASPRKKHRVGGQLPDEEKNRGQTVGGWLSSYRKERKLTLRELADTLGITPAYLSYLEQGKRGGGKPGGGQKLPARIAERLNLKPQAEEELFQIAGLSKPSESSLGSSYDSDIKRVQDELRYIAITSAKKRALLRDLRSLLQRYEQTSAQKVSTAIVPVAGWQPRLLAMDSIKRMVRPVIEEAHQSGLKKIGIVVTPQMHRPLRQFCEELEKQLQLEISLITQDASRQGLGAAILQTEDTVKEDAFAILLPDNHIHSTQLSSVCQKLIDIYETYQYSVIAVKQALSIESPSNKKGVVQLGTRLDPNLDVYPIQRFEERRIKPEESYIIGRYILSKNIFAVLKSTPHDSNDEVQLTDALEKMTRQETIYACEFNDIALYHISPARMMLNDLINLVIDAPNDDAINIALSSLALEIAPSSIEAKMLNQIVKKLDMVLKILDSNEVPSKKLSDLSSQLRVVLDILFSKDTNFPFAFWRDTLNDLVLFIRSLSDLKRQNPNLEKEADIVLDGLYERIDKFIRTLSKELIDKNKYGGSSVIWDLYKKLNGWQNGINMWRDLKKAELPQDIITSWEIDQSRTGHNPYQIQARR
jgi:UTP--glucose-1-phosphate uridylyltransferase